MKFFFYGLWGVVCFMVAYGGIFWAGWEEEKTKNNWLREEDIIPEIYKPYNKKVVRIKRIYFSIGAIAYTLIVSAIHFICYGSIDEMVTISSWLTRSVTYIILLVSLISQSAIDTGNTSNNRQKQLVELAKEITLSIRKFAYSRIMVSERKAYNLFVTDQIQKISRNEDLTNLFILKCWSDTWSKTLDISLEEYRENIANRIWQSFVKDDRFNEIVVEIFTVEFHKLNVKIIDIIRLFYNCNLEQVKGKEIRNKEKIQTLISEHDAILCEYETKYQMPLKEVDVNNLQELDEIESTG